MIGELRWFLFQAIGFVALPPPWDKLANVALALLILAGISWCWWRGRRALAVVGLAMLLLYPLAAALQGRGVGIQGFRFYLPLLVFVAAFVGTAIAAIQVKPLRWGLAVAVIGAMAWSSVREHGARTKYDDAPAALAFAAAHGFGRDIPVVSCTIFTPGSVWAADPSRANYVALESGVLRFDEGFLRATRMTMTRLLRADAGEIDAALGGGYLVPGGMRGLAAVSGRLIALVQPCEAGFEARLTAELASAGLRPLERHAFHRTLDGRTVLQRGETVAVLFAR